MRNLHPIQLGPKFNNNRLVFVANVYRLYFLIVPNLLSASRAHQRKCIESTSTLITVLSVRRQHGPRFTGS